MFELFMFYMGVGLVLNWVIALYVMFTDPDRVYELDVANFFLTIPIWPLTLYEIISSFFVRD